MKSEDALKFVEHSVDAHLRKFCSQIDIEHRLFADNLKLATHIDHSSGRLVATLVHCAYGIGDPNDPPARVVEWHSEFRAPATWWDAFKLHFALRWWLRWWIKKHPVKYRTERKDFKEIVTARALLPDVPTSKYGERFRFIMTGGRPLHSRNKCPQCDGIGYVPNQWCGILEEL